MTRTEQATNAFDPFGPWQTMRDRGMEAWSKMMQEFVQSDEYASASAQWLDTYLTLSKSFQRVMDEAMTQTMSQYKVPSTEDLARLSERLWNVELKLDDLDARADEIVRMLKELAVRQAEAAPPPAQAPAPVPPEPVAEVVAEAQVVQAEAPVMNTTPEGGNPNGTAVPASAPATPKSKSRKAGPREAAAGQE